MAFDPKQINAAASENANASMQSLAAASKAMQAVTNEMVSMSMDSLRQTTRAFEQMQSARSWTDIMRIQADFFRGTFAEFASRSRRIAELATSAPADLAHRATAQAERMGEQAQGATKAVVEDAKAATVGLDG